MGFLKYSVIQTKNTEALTIVVGRWGEEMLTVRGGHIQDIFWR